MTKNKSIIFVVKSTSNVDPEIPKNVKLKDRVVSPDSKIIAGQVCRVGNYKGYSDDKENNKVTPEVFKEVIKNFYADKNPRSVYLGHSDVMAQMTLAVEEPKSVGWVCGLWMQDDVLWAAIELTDLLQSNIEDGFFKFTSVYIEHDSLHFETGKNIGANLRSLAVTNQPFVRNLAPLTLSQEKNPILGFKKDIYLSEDINGENLIMAKVDETAAEEKDKAMKDDGMDVSGTDPTLDADPVELLKALQEWEGNPDLKVSEALDLLKEWMGAEDAEDAALEKGEGETPEEESTELESEDDSILKAKKMSAFVANKKALALALSIVSKERDTLALELSTLKQEKVKKEQESLDDMIANAIKNGWILPTEKSEYLQLAKLDRKLFGSMMEKRKSSPRIVLGKLVASNLAETESPANTIKTEDSEKAAHMATMQESYKAWKKEHPELFKK